MSINEIECNVREILVFRARQGLGSINYKSLAELVGLNTENFFTTWLMPILKALRRLDNNSVKAKTPRLSALVVCSSTGLPGKGYWISMVLSHQPQCKKLCQQLHGTEVAAVVQHYSQPWHEQA